ncbi:DUF4870 domain-containing protein [Radiobacillus sp. PE A8.2]|uniref:DUF4870 domain-containing protein n=1 Tax=Radiobacillus sp. PE A8.2 TaxID=3380349 RepID=UPI00388FA6AE
MPSNDEKLFAMLIYLLNLPFPIIGPLIIWLIKREESSFVDYHGKECCNLIISYTIYTAVASISILLLIGFVLLPLVGLLLFIFNIIAAVKAYGGEKYRIPLVIHFIK